MKITENITNLTQAIEMLENLKCEEFLEANGILSEEVEGFEKEIKEQIKSYQEEVKEYINYKLKERQDLLIPIPGYDEEIKRLTDLKKEKQNKAEKIENWIDYLLKAFQIEKMETDLNKLSFRKSESVSIFDEEAIPSEYKKEVVSVSIDKTEIKKAIKEWKEIPGATITEKQNLQIK